MLLPLPPRTYSLSAYLPTFLFSSDSDHATSLALRSLVGSRAAQRHVRCLAIHPFDRKTRAPRQAPLVALATDWRRTVALQEEKGEGGHVSIFPS